MRRTHATSRRAAVIGLAAALVAATGPVASAGPKDDDVDAELEALLQDSESAQDHDDGDATPPDGDAPPPGEGDATPGDADPVEVAPEPVRDPKLAKKLIAGAVKFVKKADKLKRRKKDDEAADLYKRAILAYNKAFELDPDPMTLVTAARLEQGLELWLESARRLRRALAATEPALDDKGREAAQKLLDDAKLNLGVVILKVTPDGARLVLDGADIGVTPLAEPLLLKPGEYALMVTAEGFQPFETKLVAEPGSESERSFDLEPVPVVVEAPRPPPPPPPPPLPPAPGKLPLYVGGGATVALAAGAVVTGILAVGKHATFIDDSVSAADRDAAQSSGKSLALMSDLFTTGAVVAAGVTAYWYLKIYKPKVDHHHELERERASWHDDLAVVPAIDPSGSAGLAVLGRF
ncbi:MAG: PEGA domain-containing protein [Kofleriaceae bacterium]|nr:PEGA domain-containing protein [Kofleriaceae bacterium]